MSTKHPRPCAIISVSGGVANILYLPPEMDVLIVETDVKPRYLYSPSPDEELICEIVSVDSEEGTVDLKCVSSGDGKRNNRIFRNVPASLVEWFSDENDDDFDIELEDEMEDEL